MGGWGGGGGRGGGYPVCGGGGVLKLEEGVHILIYLCLSCGCSREWEGYVHSYTGFGWEGAGVPIKNLDDGLHHTKIHYHLSNLGLLCQPNFSRTGTMSDQGHILSL